MTIANDMRLVRQAPDYLDRALRSGATPSPAFQRRTVAAGAHFGFLVNRHSRGAGRLSMMTTSRRWGVRARHCSTYAKEDGPVHRPIGHEGRNQGDGLPVAVGNSSR
jgi:hypothetical protein